MPVHAGLNWPAIWLTTVSVYRRFLSLFFWRWPVWSWCVCELSGCGNGLSVVRYCLFGFPYFSVSPLWILIRIHLSIWEAGMDIMSPIGWLLKSDSRECGWYCSWQPSVSWFMSVHVRWYGCVNSLLLVSLSVLKRKRQKKINRLLPINSRNRNLSIQNLMKWNSLWTGLSSRYLLRKRQRWKSRRYRNRMCGNRNLLFRRIRSMNCRQERKWRWHSNLQLPIRCLRWINRQIKNRTLK